MSAPVNFAGKSVSGVCPTGAAGAVYTAPASGWAEIVAIELTNTTGAGIAVTVYVGGTATGNVYGWSGTAIGANGGNHDSRKLIVNAGESVSILAGAAGLNYTISLAEVS